VTLGVRERETETLWPNHRFIGMANKKEDKVPLHTDEPAHKMGEPLYSDNPPIQEKKPLYTDEPVHADNPPLYKEPKEG
jgi:hypothetical protein